MALLHCEYIHHYCLLQCFGMSFHCKQQSFSCLLDSFSLVLDQPVTENHFQELGVWLGGWAHLACTKPWVPSPALKTVTKTCEKIMWCTSKSGVSSQLLGDVILFCQFALAKALLLPTHSPAAETWWAHSKACVSGAGHLGENWKWPKWNQIPCPEWPGIKSTPPLSSSLGQKHTRAQNFIKLWVQRSFKITSWFNKYFQTIQTSSVLWFQELQT